MDYSTLHGLIVARHFAHSGKFIFAIKYLEKVNPGISRQVAIAAVQSFGHERNSRDVEQQGESDLNTLHRRL